MLLKKWLLVMVAIFLMVLPVRYAFSANLSEIRSFNLKELNIDVAQGKCKAHFVNEALYSIVLKDFIRRELKLYSGMVDTDKNSAEVLFNIEVTNCSTRNNWSYLLKVWSNGNLVLNYTSPLYEASFVKKSIYLSVKDNRGDVLPAVFLGQALVKSLSDLTSDFYEIKSLDAQQVEALNQDFVNMARQRYKIARTDYISEAEIEPYIIETQSEDEKVRIKALDKLSRTWLYSEKLEKHIRTRIENLSAEVIAGGNDKEFRYALNALASLGSDEIEVLLSDLSKNRSLDGKLKKKIRGYMIKYRHRSSLFDQVHNTANFNVKQSWKVNQLYNRLGLYSDAEVIKALKEVYANHKENEYLVARVASVLERDFKINGIKSDEREDLHAWACKVIEHAGLVEHLELVTRVEKEARYEKVRDYAKSAKKHLTKIKRKLEKGKARKKYDA